MLTQFAMYKLLTCNRSLLPMLIIIPIETNPNISKHEFSETKKTNLGNTGQKLEDLENCCQMLVVVLK